MPTLAILSDTHVPVTARLTRAISRMDIDALLFAGDHHPTRFGVTRRSAAAWRRSVGRPLNDAVIAVPGNHDYSPDDGLAEWRERFMAWWPSGVSRIDGPGSFLADLGYLRIIGLDTGETASHLSDDQLAWLRALSTDVVRGPAIVLAHSPCFRWACTSDGLSTPTPSGATPCSTNSPAWACWPTSVATSICSPIVG
ncbi:MAG: metallophosphoesterase [Thermoleophilia bacterium]